MSEQTPQRVPASQVYLSLYETILSGTYQGKDTRRAAEGLMFLETLIKAERATEEKLVEEQKAAQKLAEAEAKRERKGKPKLVKVPDHEEKSADVTCA